MTRQPNDQEKRLLEEVYSGKPAIFDVETIIDAQFLREHILELTPEDCADDRQRSSLRWIIHRAVFTEPLDLNDGRRSGGGSLPALEFHDCDFNAGFCANGAHIDRLLFDGCKFTSDDPTLNSISLRNCRISTEFRLENLQPADKPGARKLLWVDAFASSIGTNVVIKRSMLRAPEGESSASLPEPRYALDLSTADIKCDLHLQPSVELQGGLKMRDARIGGSLWGQGLHVDDGESDSSRSSIARSNERPRAGIRARSARIAGNLVLSVDLGRLKEIRETQETKNGKDDLGPDSIRFWCKGALELSGIQVGGDLLLDGGYIGGTGEAYVALDNAAVRGRLAAEMVVPRPVVQRKRRDRELVLNIGTDINKGALYVSNCRISGNCQLHLKAGWIVADGLSVDGNLRISGDVSYLRAAGLEVHRDTTLILRNVRECNLGGAILRGTLNLSDMFFRRGTLSLREAEIEHSLVVAPLYSDSQLANVKRRKLICYPGFTLTELIFPADPQTDPETDPEAGPPQRIASVLTKGKEKVVLLDGRAHLLHSLNREHRLDIRTEEAKKEYLRLFCAYTWAEQGAFALIEQETQLPAKLRRNVPVHAIRPVENLENLLTQLADDMREKLRLSGQQYFVEAFVRYGYFLFRAAFAVAEKTGEVMMLLDNPVEVNDEAVIYEKSEVPVYRSPFRFAGSGVRSDFESSAPAAAGSQAKRVFISEVPDWSERLVRERLEEVDVDLRAARCGSLNDNAGKVWELTKPVKLEEFDYHQLFLPDDISVQSEIRFRLSWLRGVRRHSLRKRCVAAVQRILIRLGAHRGLERPSDNRTGRQSVEKPQFRAQPYAHLARVLRERGDDEFARDVEAEKIFRGACDRARRGRGGGALLLIFWWLPYGAFYRFGLAPVRAFLILVIFWLVGFLAITMLSENGLLQANITTVATAALQDPRGPRSVIPTPSTDKYIQKFPCGEAIAPALYAAELLTPILNLHQESRCDIRPYRPGDENTETLTLWDHPIPHFHWMVLPRPWEYLKALYILFGTIITSLALLTFSGIARRWEN